MCNLTFSGLMRLFMSRETKQIGSQKEMNLQVTSWTAI